MRPKRKTITFPDRWKLTYSELANIHPSHQAIANSMIEYMTGRVEHNIRALERIVMNSYEEYKVMSRFDCKPIRFKWVCISKQHCPPFKEKYAFAVYSGRNLLSAVFESENLAGSVVARKDYQP